MAEFHVRYKSVLHPKRGNESWQKDVEKYVYVTGGTDDFCCDGMRGAWNHNLIEFGNGNAYTQSAVVSIEQPQPEESPKYYPIKFCPFCAAPIITELVQAVKIVRETVTETRDRTVEREVPL